MICRIAACQLLGMALSIITTLPVSFTCAGLATNEVHLDCEDDIKMGFKGRTTTPIVEYFKEHEVSEKDSRIALEKLNLDEVIKVPAWCDECGIEKIHFCHSTAFINDHCCCEHRHAREKLPWIPHTCYVGKERCQPHTSSCSKYREIRECCCDRLLIGEYAAKFSAGARTCITRQVASWILSMLCMIVSLLFSS
ncbi:uncharacterized protein LOC129716945 [Wyeomyia smithii]|uniref:uncharacterized protein LOC129716945 n=1 Tax=Wyeomyia smithii TaxID=174621 RepID=UPI002467E37B|nr:uncharacterized protein LOC129716945 [Wyeomyia smithii]XP_055522764.1 uncharacterized protein LOC129716945 [Wyeomyia smithii]